MENKETLIKYFLPFNESLHPSRQRGSFSTFKKHRNCRPELNELTVVLQVQKTHRQTWPDSSSAISRTDGLPRNLQIHGRLFTMVCVWVIKILFWPGFCQLGNSLVSAILPSFLTNPAYRIIIQICVLSLPFYGDFNSFVFSSFGLEAKTLMSQSLITRNKTAPCP